jgi:hypothetical protein
MRELRREAHRTARAASYADVAATILTIERADAAGY